MALALAKSLIASGQRAVIINGDASQVYAAIPLLSAAPSAAEQAAVPHALFGHVDAADNYNTARWVADASAAITQAHAEDAVPILVGGTGLYLRSLLFGIAPVPPVDPALRAHIRALEPQVAHTELALLDPAAAARLSPNDRTRVHRALEVVQSSGVTLGEWQARAPGGLADQLTLAPALLLPPRDWLTARCGQRLEAMVAGGALEEVAALLARALPPGLPVLNAIGVREFAAHLSGQTTLETALEQAKIATRQYAKRQYTWFRNQPPTDWPRHFEVLNNDLIDNLVIKLRQKLLTD